jgi:hypothetical protein
MEKVYVEVDEMMSNCIMIKKVQDGGIINMYIQLCFWLILTPEKVDL